jgi:hypothetical protein
MVVYSVATHFLSRAHVFVSLVASFNSCHCRAIQMNSTTWQYNSTMQKSRYPGIIPGSPPLPTS